MKVFRKLQESSSVLVRAVVMTTVLSSLAGCAALVVGGVVGAAVVAADRRSANAQLNDEGIEIRSINRLKEKFGQRGNFNVTSYNGRVLLTGEVAGNADKLATEQIAFQVENVKRVINELTIASMTSTLGERSNDTLITSRVKTALLEAKELPSNAFKVVTERGVVYLMGLVTQREATMGTNIARSTAGVVKVIRSFEFITEVGDQQK